MPGKCSLGRFFCTWVGWAGQGLRKAALPRPMAMALRLYYGLDRPSHTPCGLRDIWSGFAGLLSLLMPWPKCLGFIFRFGSCEKTLVLSDELLLLEPFT